MSKVRDLTGQTFGFLTAIKRHGTRRIKNSYGATWLCKCVCGTTKIVATNDLVRKKRGVHSCGCKTLELRYSNKDYTQSVYNFILLKYKKTAKHKKLEFLLSRKKFISLINSKCFYCGSKDDLGSRYMRALKKQNSNSYVFKHNLIKFYGCGIDRKSSSKGYINTNVVPCCTKCNYAKGELSLKEFNNWVKKVYEYKFS